MHTVTILPLRRRIGLMPTPPVLVVIEDGPAGPAAAKAAATLARASAAEVVLVVPVEASMALTSDPAVVRARHRRLEADATAIAARVIPRLEALGLSWSMQRVDVRPSARGRKRAVDAVLRLAARRRASAVVAPVAAAGGSGLDAGSLERRQWGRPGTQAVPVVGVATDLGVPRPALTPDGRRRLEERAAELRALLGELGRHVAGADQPGWHRLEFDRTTRRLAELEGLLAEAVDVDHGPDPVPTIRLGTVVLVEAADGEVVRVRPVHPAEAHLDSERISADSPLARALLHRRAGETVTVSAPAGSYSCRILDVQPAAELAGQT